MYNVFFTDKTGKNDYEVVYGRQKAIERMKYYEGLGFTNVRIGER